MSDLQAALGLSQLERLNSIIDERHSLFRQYQSLLVDLPIRFLSVPDNVRSSLHLAVIRLLDTSPTHHRHVFEFLRSAGIGVQVHYTPIHLQPYYRNLGFREGDFPQAELYAKNAFSLPLFPGLDRKDQLRVAKALTSCFSL